MTRRLLISVFEREDDLLQATAAVRKHGLPLVDVFSPYVVHGLDRAMGLRPSRLPWVAFLLGLSGAVAILIFQYWATIASWPINVGGKPWNSLPAFIPATFEVMVLCAGVRPKDCSRNFTRRPLTNASRKFEAILAANGSANDSAHSEHCAVGGAAYIDRA
jgi:hypothetical protein